MSYVNFAGTTRCNKLYQVEGQYIYGPMFTTNQLCTSTCTVHVQVHTVHGTVHNGGRLIEARLTEARLTEARLIEARLIGHP